MIIEIPTGDDRTLKLRDGDDIIVAKFKKGKCELDEEKAKFVTKALGIKTKSSRPKKEKTTEKSD